jgi:diphthine synthase
MEPWNGIFIWKGVVTIDLVAFLKNYMLYVIGLGLADEKDISVKGLEAVKSCTRLYLEAYTSMLLVEKQRFSPQNSLSHLKNRLEEFYEKPIIIADREMVEAEADEILKDAERV